MHWAPRGRVTITKKPARDLKGVNGLFYRVTVLNVILMQNVITIAAKCNANIKCNSINAKCNKIINAKCNNFPTQNAKTFLTQNVITQIVITLELQV